MYLHLTSNDSASYYPTNSPFDFTVNLPTVLPLEGGRDRWKIALTDFKLVGRKWNRRDLYVYCDLASHDTYVSDCYRPLLRIVDKSGEIKRPSYTSVSRENVRRIRVYIRDKRERMPDIPAESVRCTIHLKR